jgi:hypothetical protein
MLVFTSVVCAQSAITEEGFRNFTWGDSLQQFETNSAQMLLLDFDRDKQLTKYICTNESHAIYDIGFYPIYYHFWQDKFVAVRAYFNGENNAGVFQHLYDSLVAQFGVSEKVEASQNQGEEVIYWQTEKTGIRLVYNQTSKKGYLYIYSKQLYIYSKQLQSDYAAFVKSLPKASNDYKNQPNGFESIEWGRTLPELKNEQVLFRVNKKTTLMGEFVKENDSKTFMTVPIVSKTYDFWQDKFFSAYVHYKSNDDKETFHKLYEKLVGKYGEPANGRYDPAEDAQYYVWPGDKTHILLYYFFKQKESYVFFVSKKLYDEKSLSQ